MAEVGWVTLPESRCASARGCFQPTAASFRNIGSHSRTCSQSYQDLIPYLRGISPPGAAAGRLLDVRHTISLLPFTLSLGILNDVDPVFDTVGQRGVNCGFHGHTAGRCHCASARSYRTHARPYWQGSSIYRRARRPRFRSTSLQCQDHGSYSTKRAIPRISRWLCILQ